MNSTPQNAAARRGGGPISTAIAWLERIPYSLIALVARGAAFEVFWRSGTVKLDDWAGTLSLFETDYKVPLVPPHIAAYMAAGLELGGAVLILAGLGTRLVALAFLGMTAVIQIFVYPEAWPTHIQWVAFLLLLLARGPGSISLDALICRLLTRRRFQRS
jgi:putative oxidoreductase